MPVLLKKTAKSQRWVSAGVPEVLAVVTHTLVLRARGQGKVENEKGGGTYLILKFLEFGILAMRPFNKVEFRFEDFFGVIHDFSQPRIKLAFDGAILRYSLVGGGVIL